MLNNDLIALYVFAMLPVPTRGLTMQKSFFAYPVKPRDITNTIDSAIRKYNGSNKNIFMEAWKINDISGVPIN